MRRGERGAAPAATRKRTSSEPAHGNVAVATVVDIHAENGMLVSWEAAGRPCTWTTNALAGAAAPGFGDRVLVARGEDGRGFIIGRLGPSPTSAATSPPRARFVTRAGATVESDPGDDLLRVFSPEGDLVFEYDASTGRSRIAPPRGDVEIASPGSLRLQASRELSLVGDTIRMTGRRAEVGVLEADLKAKRMTGRVTHGRFVFDRLETVTRSLLTRACHLRQIVEQRWSVDAERVRVAARTVLDGRGRYVNLVAKKDVRIDGEGIDLG